MPRFRTVDDLDVSGKRVLVRADLNVPVKDGNGHRCDPHRAPCADHRGADRERRQRVIVMSHFGRPKGPRPVAISARGRRAAEPRDRRQAGCNLRPTASVPRRSGLSPPSSRAMVALLENLRFHKGEGDQRSGFCEGTWRRSAMPMSTTPSRRRTGRMPRSRPWRICCRPPPAKNMQAELEALGAALENPQRPVIALIGGAKGVDQARSAEQSDRQGRAPRDRRRDGQHLSVRAGPSRSGDRCASASWPIPRAPFWPRPRKRGCEIIPAAGRGDRRKSSKRGAVTRNCRDQRRAGDRDDPRCRAPERGAHRGGFRGEPHLGVERPRRRLRDTALRARHGRAGEKGRRIDPCRHIDERRRRRRHRGGASPWPGS